MSSLQKLNRSRGKDTERGICKYLSFVREGLKGAEDMRSVGDEISGECKSVAASVVFKYLDQAETNNKRSRKAPRVPAKLVIAVVHKRSTNHENDAVIMRASDFKWIREALGLK